MHFFAHSEHTRINKGSKNMRTTRAFDRHLLLSGTNLEWMNYICLSSCCPKSFCFIIHNTTVPQWLSRKISGSWQQHWPVCHCGWGSHWLIVIACCDKANILNMLIQNCLFYRFLTFQKSAADVGRCGTYVVHLFCVF